jgi:hydrogenase-4 component C
LVEHLLAGSTNRGTISEAYATGKVTSVAAVVAATAFAVAMYFETGKVPFDMAEAEQELQEGPLIEYSGAGLGLMRLCLGLKQVLMAALLIGVFLPFGAAPEVSPPRIGLAAVLFAIKLAVAFLFIGLVESSTALPLPVRDRLDLGRLRRGGACLRPPRGATMGGTGPK